MPVERADTEVAERFQAGRHSGRCSFDLRPVRRDHDHLVAPAEGERRRWATSLVTTSVVSTTVVSVGSASVVDGATVVDVVVVVAVVVGRSTADVAVTASVGVSLGSPAMATPTPRDSTPTTVYANHGCFMSARR